MKVSISNLNLENGTLDYAVAICLGYTRVKHPSLVRVLLERKNKRGVMQIDHLHSLAYSTKWIIGGPVIEGEKFAFDIDEDMETIRAYYPFKQGAHDGIGKTHLEAAMRCLVANKLGEEIEIPDLLL